MAASTPNLALCIQPACLEHKYIRHANSSHIFERPERLRAVLLGFAAALARLEETDASNAASTGSHPSSDANGTSATAASSDLSDMLSSLSLGPSSSSAFLPPSHITLLPPPPRPSSPGQVLLYHPALQLAHSEPIEAPFPYLPREPRAALPNSTYLRNLFRWATEAIDNIKKDGCEIPDGLGLNPGDLYLGPGSIVAIEGATVCQAVDGVCAQKEGASTPPATEDLPLPPFTKAFCAIRPPGHHCGEDEPSGFCYVNNVVVGAMHAYLQHDVDRAIIIDFDLHHGNGTQALVMPLNASTYAEDLAVAAGKPPSSMLGRNGPRRGWQGFYGSVHDIYSYPCEDGDLDLIKDASLSLAAHGQYIENIHLQPYADEDDFYTRIYPKYLALLDKAKVFMQETKADPDRTVVFISAGFDACEHEHQGMQRHDRRVPASFYSRCTRDIVAFADEYAGGKVVSVLEGGYGDRALTSAAMGHAIGLLGRKSVPSWLDVDELARLERFKRRRGKLCTLQPDLAALPHVARTHALLAHFEGKPAVTPAPSVNATPQHPHQRMTLRTRNPRTGGGDDESPRPAPRRKARTPKATPTPTPKRDTVKERETMAAAVAATPIPVTLVGNEGDVQVKTESITVKTTSSPPKKVPSPPKRTPSPPKKAPSPPKSTPSPPKRDPSPPKRDPSPTKRGPQPATTLTTVVKNGLPSPAPSSPPAEHEPGQRIMLRIPRVTPETTPQPEQKQPGSFPAQPPAQATQARPPVQVQPLEHDQTPASTQPSAESQPPAEGRRLAQEQLLALERPPAQEQAETPASVATVRPSKPQVPQVLQSAPAPAPGASTPFTAAQPASASFRPIKPEPVVLPSFHSQAQPQRPAAPSAQAAMQQARIYSVYPSGWQPQSRAQPILSNAGTVPNAVHSGGLHANGSPYPGAYPNVDSVPVSHANTCGNASASAYPAHPSPNVSYGGPFNHPSQAVPLNKSQASTQADTNPNTAYPYQLPHSQAAKPGGGQAALYPALPPAPGM